MNVLRAMRERRAVRDYTPEPVSPGMIYQLLSSASWAPSALNEQPCHFTVITDEKLLDEVSVKAKAWLLENISSLPQPALFRDLLKDDRFHLLYHAPVLIVISAPTLGPWAVE